MASPGTNELARSHKVARVSQKEKPHCKMFGLAKQRGDHGDNGIADVRQGKYFLLPLEDSLAANPAAARQEVERIAHEVLTNPVIEEYSLRLEP